MSLSKNEIKHLTALHQKKFRQIHDSFIVEGDKMVRELLNQSQVSVEAIYAVEPWIKTHELTLDNHNIPFYLISDRDLGRISNLKSPNHVLAKCAKPKQDWQSLSIGDELVLYLDSIQDPGNMGTIIRTADWFGVNYVFCNQESVEFYNPKVIQSTMGAFMRVHCLEVELSDLCARFSNLPVYGTNLKGNNIYEYSLSSTGIIVIGNESRGVSQESSNLVQHELTIPLVADRQMESLNAAVATGIVLSIFRQQGN